MNKYPIILLHGWGLSGKIFEPLATALRKQGYKVYFPDFPGFGTSAVPEKPLYLSDYAEFLHGFVKKHHIVQPVLVGHSFGGRVGLKYQLLHSKSVRALILTGTPGFTPINRKKLILFILLAKIGKAFFSLPPFHLCQDIVRRWYYYLVGARDFYRAEGVMRDTFKHIVQEDLLDCMKAVRIPVLLLWGQNDTIVPVSVVNKMKEVIPGAKLEVVSGSDHGVAYKKPSTFADRLVTFLNSL